MTAHDRIEGLAIADVSRALMVPAPTLRAWERRYGIPATDRSPGGHRRYTPEQVDALRLMRDEISRGRRASAAARAVRELLTSTGESAPLVDAFLSASLDSDAVTMRAVLDRSLTLSGVDATLDAVLIPAMRRIGLWWSAGRCDTTQEALATEVCRGWINRMLGQAGHGGDGRRPPVLLACAPADEHTVGIESLELCLRVRGVPARSLGARVSDDALRAAVLASEPPAVIISCQLPSGRRRAIESLATVSSLGVAVSFYAGSAFSSDRSRRGVPGEYLASSFASAADRVRDVLLSSGMRRVRAGV